MRRRVGAFLLLLAISAIQLTVVAPASAADGQSNVASTTYTLNPDAGRLDVVIDLTVANSTASTTSYVACTQWTFDYWIGWYQVPDTCPQTTNYYLNDTFVWIERGATALKVTADRGAAGIKLSKSGDSFDQYRVTFSKIFNGQKHRLEISYQVPGGAPRSDSSTRVGLAFASFCVFANGIDSGTTQLVVPSAYEFAVDGGNGAFTSTTTGAMTTYQTDTLSKPSEFWTCLTGDNPAGFLRSSFVSPRGRTIELQSWPEDPGWNDQIKEQITDALGELERLVGRGLPGDGSIVVREVSSVELGGQYAGTFDPESGVARVSENLEPGTVAHELSHAWFNGTLFDNRWLSEGSAGWAESTVTGAPCDDPGAFPGSGKSALSDWEFLGPKASLEALAVVGYQYDASCFLVSTLADRMGPEGMKRVLAALLDHEMAYRSGDLVLAGHSGVQDWRDWLDAVDELGLVPSGATDLDYAQVLLTRFGAVAETSMLPSRSNARAAYHELVGSVGDWDIPEAVLRPMGEWRYPDATAAMAGGARAYASVLQVEDVLPEVDALDGPVKGLFENARDLSDIQDAESTASDQEAAAKAVATASTTLAAPRDLIAQIGLIGTDLGPSLTAGIAAVSVIDLDTALEKAALINRTISDAAQQGVIRVAISIGILVLVALLLFLLRRRLMSARRASAAIAESASAIATSSDSPEPFTELAATTLEIASPMFGGEPPSGGEGG